MRRVYPVSLCFFPALVHFFTKDLVVPSASNRLGSESSTHAYLKKGCLAAAHIFCGNKAPEVWIPGCGAFWVPDQNNALRFSGFQPDARSARRSGRMRLTGEGPPGACCFGFPTKTTPFASRAFSPKRAYARRSGRMRLTGEGSKAASVWPQTKRIGAGRLPRVFSAGAEARHTPRRPCGLPHGRWVSDPSPCAPPRQAGKPGPIGHSVVGFCGTARGEWAGPVWAKNRSRRAVTCVSLPPSQRRAPFRGIHKGASPLCVLFTLLFAQAKNKPSARTGPGILCRSRHTS